MARKKDQEPGGLVVVDKPAGFTSHDVVAKLRGMAHTRRVGHAGTLDPMATGVLVVGTGKTTRLLGHLALTEKEYTATVRLGQNTVTEDAEGEVTDAPGASGITGEAVGAAVGKLTGRILQVPSKVSAVKVDGKRSYQRVREGEAVELAAREITVSAFDVHEVRGGERAEDGTEVTDLLVSVVCSSGTYVRALARDLGESLGTGGHLTALRRTRVGPYRLADARSLEELQSEADSGAGISLLPLGEAAAAAFPRWDVDSEAARLIGNGVQLRMPARESARQEAGAPASGAAGASAPVAVFGPEGGLVALVEERDGRAKSLAVFV
ncbi:tRNA pseudouridine synthase B [Streptomyces abyssalis]|uniref:tRNA pseudouridine synthase B n=1 Tax=Streptomyces abyssalis TaxID=933944 RepID=A0A1E7JHH4_9ACTN|nr:tRNA pseudouridine(55) synthase TruB [Streptomyces abyssalis]OEU85936.1 tRNA pseudouridine synthase B [Streptomyces abyssalis]OEU92596.1 tRNA pseudouridine synthase B [Streptomyces abyssalis]